jgi:hypothetical protein
MSPNLRFWTPRFHLELPDDIDIFDENENEEDDDDEE